MFDLEGRCTNDPVGGHFIREGTKVDGGCLVNVQLLSEFKLKGNLSLLDEPLTALFCSNSCPGDLILKTYDLARAMRDAGVPVIGGFQTPMERECLRLLLRGKQPVVVCPARSIDNMQIPRDWRAPLDDGRLLVLSPFPATARRPTAELAAQRNELVSDLAQRVFIAHAAPGSKTEAFARKLVASGKPMLTVNSPANTNLVEMGAEVVCNVNLPSVSLILRNSYEEERL